ncbi:MAG: hypothetical protein JWP95_338 [Actinotalea sp.]|nr:hypothetical protein [Actinotalea sp.]
MSRAACPVRPPRRRSAVRTAFTAVLSGCVAFSTLVVGSDAARAVTDENPEFHVNRADLEFILEQIKISEAHAAGGNLVCATRTDLSGTCVPDPRLPWGLRTVDGSYNNLMPDQEHFGAGGQVMPRLAPANFRPGETPPPGAPPGPGGPGATTSYTQSSGFVYDSLPRLASNLIVDQTTANPAAVAAAESVDGSVINPNSPNGDGDLQFTRLEEGAPGLAYSAGWTGAATPDRRSGDGGAYLYTDSAGSSVTVAFQGSAVRWITAFGPARGIATVSLDGGEPVEVDLYATEWSYQATGFQALGLASGSHTLTITNAGSMNPASSTPRIEVDAVEVGVLVGETSTAGDVFIPNVSPDEGLSAPFTSWFTLFGQFFDHGLDLVSKGGNGTVVVPLQPDDPLYDAGGADGVPHNGDETNFIMLTRATQVRDEAGDIQNINRTTPFIDQNQTYTSHPSHQAFLREYTTSPDGPVPTGQLLDGSLGGLATWNEIKSHVQTQLGIALDDMDAIDVPLLATDPYGRFIAGPDGYPQLVVLADPTLPDTPANRVLLEGDPAAPVDASLALSAGHAFLDDIAHTASPNVLGEYDSAALGAHYITGDGRGNENIGLTAVHHVFHSEHNRLVGHVEDVLEATGDAAFIAQWHDETGHWDYGERLFQAARFVTEMEYQHLAFEEFGRTVQPNIDNQPLNETAYHADINPAITAEFAHVVYRFGHSMLTDTVARDGFGAEDLSLLDAFLNPAAFTDSGAMTPDQGAAAVIQGMARQTGNGIDEFVIPTLRNELLGLPLDLATINMARARDTGMPTLQEARLVFWDATNDGGLKPYDSWEDFRLSMRHRASIVNFIAAYGIHPTLQAVSTVDDKRAAAAALSADPAFMNLPAAQSGLNDVDFWIGGLAEDGLVFGGLLGSSFNFVFEQQLEHLQNADRFYYLTRTQGLNLMHQLENNSFTELALRNTDADLLHADIFANPDAVFDLDGITEPYPAGLSLVNGVWRYDGVEHIVLHGTDTGESIRSDKGDDSVWAHGGNDVVEGGQGDDTLHGGSDDDVITDVFGDDTIHGGPGNDAINAGSGFDLIFGNTGRDFVLHGQEITTSFAGADADLVRGGNANDLMAGNEGDDWLEGANGHDLVQGDNALTFQNDPVGGADVLYGGSGNDDHDAEGGDDIMLNNGIDRHAGMLGFDWVTHKDDPFAGDSDLDISIFQPPNVDLMRARFMNVEGLSGWDAADVLRGRSDPGDPAFADTGGHTLSAAGLDRILGLRALLGGGDVPVYAAPFMAINQANDILLGGAGSDLLQGRAGDDYLDGDAALDIYLLGPGGERQESMHAFQTRIFAGDLVPGDLATVREVVTATGQEAVIDTAIYEDVLANHTITDNGDGTWRVAHVDEDAGGLTSGVDILRNVERVVFADQTVDLVELANGAAFGTMSFSTMSPVEDQALTVVRAFDDPQGVQTDSIVYTWQWADNEGEWTSSVDGVGETFTPGDAEAGWPLRVIATFLDGEGTMETITSPATLPVQNVNDVPTGLSVHNTSPTVGDVLTATGLVDNDGLTNDDGEPTAVLSYRWQQGSGTSFTDIPGAMAPSVTLTSAQEGRQVRVIVSYTDNQGTAESPVSPATDPVTAQAAPTAVVGPEAIAFAQQVGTRSASQVVTISNTGSAPLTITGAALSGPHAASFTAQSGVCLVVDVGGSCEIPIIFTPTVVGAHTAQLTVEHSAGTGTSTVALSGEGTLPLAPAMASVSPDALAFAAQATGTTSAAQVVTLSNTGESTLTVASVAVSGPQADAFAATTGCTAVAAGSSCTVSVTFGPDVTGAHEAVLTIQHNAGSGTTQVSLTGDGTVAGGTPGGGGPVIDPVETYIANVYLDLFDRAPDPSGLAGWAAALTSGTPRIEVANAITSSREYRSQLITASYQKYLGRSPDLGGLESWLEVMAAGYTISHMEAGFIASDEYYGRSGSTDSGWVRKLYTDVLGREAGAGEVAGWVASLQAGATRTQVATGFLLSTEHLSAVIDGYYVDLLGRHLDAEGQIGWVSALQAGTRHEAIIGGIIASEEYYAKR